MAGFKNEVMNAINVNFGTVAAGAAEITADGQLMIGSAVAPNIRPATLTAGAGINITNGAGSITVTNTGGSGITWSVVAVNTLGATNNGYITNDPVNIDVSLPAVSAVGDTFEILRNIGGGSWSISQGAGQQILAANSQTTVGVAGSVTSTNMGDSITLICIVPNLTWGMSAIVGNLTVV